MFRELFDLPAHALIVHAAVVFIPLAAVAAIVYALWPRGRQHIWWAVLGLAVLAPITAWAAVLSGQEYERIWIDRIGPNPQGGALNVLHEIDNHQSLGNLTAYVATALGVVLLVAVLWALPGPLVKGAAAPTVVRIVTAVVTIGLALATLYYAIRTGDAGARVSHEEI
jgi:4-amino-4-deoxy-L-arabinose transferase-like glycosyltransferase